MQATLAGETQTVTTYTPGASSAATVALDPKLPLEAHVERETVTLKLRGSVQLGFYFESLVQQGGVANPKTVIQDFRNSFPISATVPDPVYAPVSAVRFRVLMAGRVADGEALYTSAAAVAADQKPSVPLPASASNPGMAAVLATFVEYRASLFTQPNADSAWQDTQLDYDFSLGSPAPGQSISLSAPEFPGGHLDWYSFAFETGVANPLAASNPAQVTPLALTSCSKSCHFPRRARPAVVDPRRCGHRLRTALTPKTWIWQKLLVMEFCAGLWKRLNLRA